MYAKAVFPGLWRGGEFWAEGRRLMEKVASPGEAGHEGKQGSEEGLGEALQPGGCIAQLLLTTVVSQIIGA